MEYKGWIQRYGTAVAIGLTASVVLLGVWLFDRVNRDTRAFHLEAQSHLGMSKAEVQKSFPQHRIYDRPTLRRHRAAVGPTPPDRPCEEVIWVNRGLGVAIFYVDGGFVTYVHCAQN